MAAKRAGYRFRGHTADVEYVAYGETIESCFKNALMGMFDTIAYVRKVSSSRSKTISFNIKDEAQSIEDLLWYALQDALSMADSKDMFAYRVSNVKISESTGSFRISMSIHGKKKVTAVSKLDVKGVSRYNLGIRKNGARVSATVVLDV